MHKAGLPIVDIRFLSLLGSFCSKRIDYTDGAVAMLCPNLLKVLSKCFSRLHVCFR